MESSLEELINKLEQLKNIDLENPDSSGYELFQSFFKIENVLKQKLKWCNIAINGIELESFEKTMLELSIFSMILDIMSESNNFNCISILSLLRNKTEPNYNILQKIKFGSKANYENIIDLVFAQDNKPLKIIQLIEYLRQRGYSLEQFLNLAIRVRVIYWFEEFEPKTLYWINDFFNSVPASYQINIEDILELLKS